MVIISCHTLVAGYYGITLAVRPSVFSFLDDNLSKRQWIFTKLCVLIDIVEIWFGIVNGQFHQFLTELSAWDRAIFSFSDDNFSKYQWISTKLGVCIDIVEICFEISDRQILSIFDRVICLVHFHFWMIILLNISGFSPNLVCA